MKRMYYVSRFSRPLTKKDLAAIQDASLRNNPSAEVTGFLVCLGDTFFQVLEGPTAAIDQLYYERIVPDDRHTDVVCLKSETAVRTRMFPEWHMKVFNLNEEEKVLPFAFQQMLTALVDSHHTIARYTQPSVSGMLEQGVNPMAIRPRRRRVTVLYSDIIGFSYFAQSLTADELLDLVNSHVEACVQGVTSNCGQVNKLTGDGVLAYFPGASSEAALRAAVDIIATMKDRRSRSQKSNPHRLLYGGIGLAHGLVFEGNVGLGVKRDFTILGNTVNLASRLECSTRDFNVRLTLDSTVARRAKGDWRFSSLGKKQLKGQNRPVEILTLDSLPKVDVSQLYDEIQSLLRSRKN